MGTPLTQNEREGRESTTEQSLGGNAADLVGWASQDTHEIATSRLGGPQKPTLPMVISWVPLEYYRRVFIKQN